MIYKFLCKCFLICLLLTCVDYFAGIGFKIIYDKAYDLNPHSYIMIPRFAAEDVDADILIIGASDASHNYIPSMITDSLGLSCYNLGRDGSFFVYQNCMINMILDRYQPKMIVWEMMEDCFTTPFNYPQEYQAISSLYPFYGKSEYVKEIIDKRQKSQKILMLSSLYRNNSNILTLLNSTKRIWGTGGNGYDPLPSEGYDYPKLVEDEIIDLFNSEKTQMLEATLKRCNDLKVPVVIASAPKFTDGKLKKGEAFHKIIEISKECNVSIIGSKDDPIFRDGTLYKDNNHLNDKGAHIYMHQFIPQIKEVLKSYNY